MTIEFKGIRLEVLASVTGGEPMVMYYPDGSGHPGSAPEVEIEEILFEDVDVFEIYESLGFLEEISALYLENYDPTN